MIGVTHAEALKKVRKAAKDNEMTFKKQEDQHTEGKVLYQFVDRRNSQSQKVYIDSTPLSSAYFNCCVINGFLESLR